MTHSANARKTIDVVLKTDDFILIFHFLRTPFPDSAYVTISITGLNVHGQPELNSTQAYTSKQWLLRFCTYLLNHARNIKHNPNAVSPEFMGEGMLYKAVASGGCWNEDDYATFNLAFWIDAGITKRIWMGIETQIDSREIERFYQRIKR